VKKKKQFLAFACFDVTWIAFSSRIVYGLFNKLSEWFFPFHYSLTFRLCRL